MIPSSNEEWFILDIVEDGQTKYDEYQCDVPKSVMDILAGKNRDNTAVSSS